MLGVMEVIDQALMLDILGRYVNSILPANTTSNFKHGYVNMLAATNKMSYPLMISHLTEA